MAEVEWSMSPLQVWMTIAVVMVTAVLLVIRLTRKQFKLPPGPTPWPVLGNIRELNPNQPSHITFMEMKRKYGDIFLLHLGSNPSVVLNTIELVREAFVQKSADFAGRPHFSSAWIFTEGGQDIALGQFNPRWQIQHKIAQAAFRRYATSASLEQLIHQTMDPVLEYMGLEKEPFNPVSIISMLVYNIRCSMCFGKLFELDDPEFKKIVQANEEMMHAYGNGMASDFMPWLDYLPTGSGKELKKSTDKFLQFLYRAVEEHKDVEGSDKPSSSDLTHELLHQQKLAAAAEGDVVELLADKHLVQILSDLFFVGVDTTRYTLYWFLQYMAAHPDIQHKLQDEIDEVVGRVALVRLSHRESLPCVHAALYEVMRMRPWVPVTLPHQVMNDTAVGEYEIPAGFHCYANIWALHYDPRHWDEPLKFNPGRFLDTNNKQLGPKPKSWLPFSAGLRACLGESLANSELPLIASALLQQYTFHPVEGEELQVLRTTTLDRQSTIPEAFNIVAETRS